MALATSSNPSAAQKSFNWRWLRPMVGLGVGGLVWWLWTSPVFQGLPWQQGMIFSDFSPEKTLGTLLELLRSGALFPHLITSLRRVFVGLLGATLIGIPLGIFIGLSRALDQVTSALFQFIRMISPLSWMPLAVMVLGVGDRPVYFLLTIAAVWPILLNTAAGVAAVDRRWLLLSRSLCATSWETLLRVILPAIVPHILTGIRLAIGIIWVVLVPAEMLGVSAGLGYYILDTRDRLAYSELLAVILVIGALGYGLDAMVRSLQRIHHARP
ncbi:ABC transporter permease [Alkalinema pantanalense CENA528]|uniref:ABC transporter permease n=1 Tax=Alkalinema pantanalense TaxID=1620705 RepID=UPI003D6EED97